MLGPSKYSFWWTPKPVTGRYCSMRAQKGSPTTDPYRNVMYDKRVIRGSNYGATAVLAEFDPFDKAAQVRRRNALRKRVITRNQRNVLGTPPPVIGRRHEIIQTDQYLEELLEHPPVRTADTQTDLFLEQPPTPPYFVASKIGIDVGTSIEEGDLMQDVADSTNLEEPLIERFVEACIFDTAQEFESETTNTAGKILENQIAKVLPNVLDKLEPQHTESEREQLMSSLCPWLSEQVADEVAQIVDSQEILSIIIEEIIKLRGEACASESESAASNDIEEGKTI